MLALFLLTVSASVAEPVAFRCLADAYPEWVTGFRGSLVLMRDGSTLAWDDGKRKTPAERIENPDLEDLWADPYPRDAEVKAPAVDEDPGRARVTPLFEGFYGKSDAEVQAALVEVAWLGKTPLRFNRRQGAAAALRRVSAELEKLPPRFHKYFELTAGTFNRRAIAGTSRPSAHSWGIAIDLDVKNSDYWRWNLSAKGVPAYRNRIPIEIVRIFERHGFIWGGRWFHYDTMHFEYRPELLDPRCARKQEATP